MLNIRDYNNKEQLLFPPSIGDFIPKDDLVHVVDEAVEEIDLTPYYKKISPVGNPSYDPCLLIKVWFYGYCVRTYSSRKIEDKLYRDVGFIYLAGMQKPDFRTISDFRKNNLKELKNSFVEIVRICHRLGMTQLGNISLDSKVMKANASVKRTYDEKDLIKERQELEKAIEEYLQKANKTDDEEDEKYGSDKRGNELPEDIRDKESRIKKIKQIVEELKQVEQKLKNSDKEKINLTDSDSQIQKGKGGKYPGYRAQIAVDSKEQVIVTNDVTSEQSDNLQLIPMIDKTLENVKEISPEKFSKDNQNEEPIKLSADSGYSLGKNLAELEKERYKGKIDPYIPDVIYQGKENKRIKCGPFDKNKFNYDKDNNQFICPEGKILKQVGCEEKHSHKVFNYQCKECISCPHFGKCTKNRKGRKISIGEHEELINKMRQKLSTKEGKEIYGKRKITVEPVFGNLGQNLGFREFSLRGIQKVKGEFSLMCSAHNILKIARVIRNLGRTLKEALALTQISPVINSS